MTSVHWSSKLGTISETRIFLIFKLSKNSIMKAFSYIPISINMKKIKKNQMIWYVENWPPKWKYFSRSGFGQNLLPVNPCPQDSTTEVMLILLCMYIMYYHMISATVITNQYRFSGVDNLRISYTYDLAANSAILTIDFQYNFVFKLIWKYSQSGCQ